MNTESPSPSHWRRSQWHTEFVQCTLPGLMFADRQLLLAAASRHKAFPVNNLRPDGAFHEGCVSGITCLESQKAPTMRKLASSRTNDGSHFQRGSGRSLTSARRVSLKDASVSGRSRQRSAASLRRCCRPVRRAGSLQLTQDTPTCAVWASAVSARRSR